MGETPRQALVRELQEELQIVVNEADLVEFGTFYSQAAYDPDKTLQLDAFLVHASELFWKKASVWVSKVTFDTCNL